MMNIFLLHIKNKKNKKKYQNRKKTNFQSEFRATGLQFRMKKKERKGNCIQMNTHNPHKIIITKNPLSLQHPVFLSSKTLNL